MSSKKTPFFGILEIFGSTAVEWQNQQVILFGCFSPPEMKEKFKSNTSWLTEKEYPLRVSMLSIQKSNWEQRWKQKNSPILYAKLSSIKKKKPFKISYLEKEHIGEVQKKKN